MKALEVVLLSASPLSCLLIMAKGAVLPPYSCELVFSSLSGFWDSIRCFLSSPLYVCIIINSMVALIIASSCLHHGRRDDEINVDADDHRDTKIVESAAVSVPSRRATHVSTQPPSSRTDISTRSSTSSITLTYHEDSPRHVGHDGIKPKGRENANPSPPTALFFQEAREIKEIARSLASEPTREKKVISTSHPPLPFREKEVGDGATTDPPDTMEMTWKGITESGNQRPKKKQLKKGEPCGVKPPPRRTAAMQRLDSEEVLPSTPKWKEVKKAVTFNDAMLVTRRGGLIRSYPSMNREESNKHVEAFIWNFYDNLRLQRQESVRRFLDTIEGRV